MFNRASICISIHAIKGYIMNKSKLSLLILSISSSMFVYSTIQDKQLIEAAKSGNIQQAQAAIEKGADINVVATNVDLFRTARESTVKTNQAITYSSDRSWLCVFSKAVT